MRVTLLQRVRPLSYPYGIIECVSNRTLDLSTRDSLFLRENRYLMSFSYLSFPLVLTHFASL